MQKKSVTWHLCFAKIQDAFPLIDLLFADKEPGRSDRIISNQMFSSNPTLFLQQRGPGECRAYYVEVKLDQCHQKADVYASSRAWNAIFFGKRVLIKV